MLGRCDNHKYHSVHRVDLCKHFMGRFESYIRKILICRAQVSATQNSSKDHNSIFFLIVRQQKRVAICCLCPFTLKINILSGVRKLRQPCCSRSIQCLPVLQAWQSINSFLIFNMSSAESIFVNSLQFFKCFSFCVFLEVILC